ncbi:lasso peptide biosynthesis B2 protein [Haloarcula salina]|uniref:lasso peptide biosynthesis B2 protein n=1 Tax=Haloarcula salina TaxID=1429914 RepID=UPI003C6FC0AF
MLVVSSKALLSLLGLDSSVRWVGFIGRVCPPSRSVESVDQIPWAVDAVAARLPGEFDCLDRAVAGNALLVAGGYRGRIRLGVDKRDGAFEAHAWVECDDEVLIGDLEDLDRFRPLPESEVASF